MEVNRYKVQKKISFQAFKFMVKKNDLNNFSNMNVTICINYSQGCGKIHMLNCSKKSSDVTTWCIFLFPIKNINISEGTEQGQKLQVLIFHVHYCYIFKKQFSGFFF